MTLNLLDFLLAVLDIEFIKDIGPRSSVGGETKALYIKTVVQLATHKNFRWIERGMLSNDAPLDEGAQTKTLALESSLY